MRTQIQPFVTATLSYGIDVIPGDQGGFDSATGVSRDRSSTVPVSFRVYWISDASAA
jgi:hypothetical protein